MSGPPSDERAVRASTVLAAVIGRPVDHSLSPVIHNAAFAATRLDWVYLAFDVGPASVGAALAGMRGLGIGGLNVTMPHKEAVAAAVDRCTADAEALGAVNTVVWEDGQLVGHNTDGAGFIDALRADLDLDPAGARVAVLGAGGAARSVIRSLTRAGAAELVVVNRSRDRAERAVVHAPDIGRVGTPDDVARADLVVHATPVGMGGASDEGVELPVPATVFGPGQVVCDLIYAPLEPPLLRAAAARGAQVSNGVGMLVHQAAHSFRLWTGHEPPVAVMAEAIRTFVRPDGR